MKTQNSTWDAKLPATPCDREMRESMEKRAAAEGKKLAHIQREAFALFLSQSAT